MGRNLLVYLFGLLLLISVARAPTMGGSTYLDNLTYPATLSLTYENNPWIFVDTTALIKFNLVFNNTQIKDGKVFLDLNGTTANMSWSPGLGAYSIYVLFNSTENGTKNYYVNATRLGYVFNNLTGNFKVTQAANVKVRLWKEVNGTRYKNEFGYILALPINGGDHMEKSKSKWENQLQPMQDFIVWGDRTFGGNTTKLYKYPQRVWHAPYRDGQATLALPKNQQYALYFVSGNYIFDADYGYAYYTKTYSDKVFLEYRTISDNVLLDYLVSNWELNKMKLITLWAIMALAMLVLIGVIVVMARINPIGAVSLFSAMFVLIPMLYYLLKWVLGL